MRLVRTVYRAQKYGALAMSPTQQETKWRLCRRFQVDMQSVSAVGRMYGWSNCEKFLPSAELESTVEVTYALCTACLTG